MAADNPQQHNPAGRIMFKYFGWIAQNPIFHTVGEVIYYGTIIGVIGAFLVLAARRWIALGYDRKRVLLLAGLLVALSYPLGHLGSRGASMFYRPFEQWSFSFLLEQMLHGSSHTFHASLILPTLFGALLCYLLRFKFLEIFDTLYLYVPLAHAFGRLSCLIVGCCWGRYVHLNLFGLHLGFQNPIPLYAIGVNVAIFLLLRRIHTRVYADAWTRVRYRGAVLASYLLLYPPVRIVFEVFRTERRIFHGLTHAQVAMGLFMLLGLMLLVAIRLRHRRLSREAAASPPEPAAQTAADTLQRYFAMIGILSALILISFLIHYVTREIRVWPWPIQPVTSLADAYSRIWYYLPVMLVPAGCLLWMRRSGMQIWPWFKWNRFSYTFFIALAMSLYHCIDLLVLRQAPLRGAAFWPPVLILSALNAVTEEIMYRLALYRMLRRIDVTGWVANVVQALVYSLIHFMIAGAWLGIFSFIYGLVLGVIVQRSKSITPAIVVHFIVDLGAIGYPLLRL